MRHKENTPSTPDHSCSYGTGGGDTLNGAGETLSLCPEAGGEAQTSICSPFASLTPSLPAREVTRCCGIALLLASLEEVDGISSELHCWGWKEFLGPLLSLIGGVIYPSSAMWHLISSNLVPVQMPRLWEGVRYYLCSGG